MSLPKNPTKSFIARNPDLYPVGDKFAPVKLEDGHAHFEQKVLSKMDGRGLVTEEMPHGKRTTDERYRAYLAAVFGHYGEFILEIKITGQIIGGKNNICITRTGRRFPNKKWAAWRDLKVGEVRARLPKDFKTIDHPVNVEIDYVAGDKRRRDFPAICDSIWHVLEKAGVVSDDTLLWPSKSTRGYSKEMPMTILRFYK